MWGREPTRSTGGWRVFFTPLILMSVILSLCVASAMGQGKKPAKGPATSAFDGNVGDWAIGHWKGTIWNNYSNTPMYTEERTLDVERLPDGKVGCRWAYPPDMPVGWAPKCKIDEKGISLLSTAGSDVELSRSGVGLEGRMRTKSSVRWLAQLKRVQ